MRWDFVVGCHLVLLVAFIRCRLPLYILAVPPVSPLSWLTLSSVPLVHDVPDGDRAETWQWNFSYTWRHDSEDMMTDPQEIRKTWRTWSEKLGEPLRTPFLTLPEEVTL